MLKQLPSRNQRSKGFKVKHFLQICLSIAICYWLFNQLKHSYATKKASLEDNSAGELSENSQITVEGVPKLGRKHLYPRMNDKTALGVKEDEIKGENTEDDKDEEELEEVEDLIDVDDRDIKDVGNEDSEDKGNLLDQYARNKAEMKSQEIGESH